MFYFFHRGKEFVRCEINGDEANGYRITVTEPSGAERVETSPSSEAAHARWLEIQEQLNADGWWGPSGRD